MVLFQTIESTWSCRSFLVLSNHLKFWSSCFSSSIWFPHKYFLHGPFAYIRKNLILHKINLLDVEKKTAVVDTAILSYLHPASWRKVLLLNFCYSLLYQNSCEFLKPYRLLYGKDHLHTQAWNYVLVRRVSAVLRCQWHGNYWNRKLSSRL